jgi:hypothetical protein
VQGVVEEIAKLEETITFMIIDMKISSIRVSVITYYSVIAKVSQSYQDMHII